MSGFWTVLISGLEWILDLMALREPDRSTSTGRILADMSHHIEPVLLQQRTIFGDIQTRMIQPSNIPMASPNEVPLVNIGGAPNRAYSLKGCEHGALVIVGEMEEAVPGDQAVKGPRKFQRSHIGDEGLLVTEVALYAAIISGALSTPVTENPQFTK